MIITQRVINGGDSPKMIHDHDRGAESAHDDLLDSAMDFRGSRVDDLRDVDSHGGDRGRPDDDHDVPHDDVAHDHATEIGGDALGERNHDRQSGFCQMDGPVHSRWKDGVGGRLLHGVWGLLVCWRQKKQEQERGSISKTWPHPNQ